MTSQDIANIVSQLNTELYEKHGEIDSSFSYETNCYVDVIKFDGMQIWNDQDDDRYIDDSNEQIPLDYHIKKQFNALADKLKSLKFKLKNSDRKPR